MERQAWIDWEDETEREGGGRERKREMKTERKREREREMAKKRGEREEEAAACVVTGSCSSISGWNCAQVGQTAAGSGGARACVRPLWSSRG